MIIFFIGNICYATGGMDFNLGRSILKLVFYTLVFIVVVITAIYGTKFIAKKSEKFINSKHMKVLDILKLDLNTKITIIKINKMVYILAMTNNTVKVLDKYSEDEIEIDSGTSFEDELNKFTHNSIGKNRYIGELQRKINELLNKSNKSADEEEKNNEKMG